MRFASGLLQVDDAGTETRVLLAGAVEVMGADAQLRHVLVRTDDGGIDRRRVVRFDGAEPRVRPLDWVAGDRGPGGASGTAP